MDYTAFDEERVYWTATGMVWALEASRVVADMTAEARWPGSILGRTVINSHICVRLKHKGYKYRET